VNLDQNQRDKNVKITIEFAIGDLLHRGSGIKNTSDDPSLVRII
jgi:hypothetical protein